VLTDPSAPLPPKTPFDSLIGPREYLSRTATSSQVPSMNIIAFNIDGSPPIVNPA
jgi:hypothetical protein